MLRTSDSHAMVICPRTWLSKWALGFDSGDVSQSVFRRPDGQLKVSHADTYGLVPTQ